MGHVLAKLFCIENSKPPQEHPPVNAPPQPSQQDITIINLKSLRDDLLNQKKKMTSSIEKTEVEIKAHLMKKNKEQAVYAIKKKKLYEEYLSVSENKYVFIQKAIMEVEKSIIDKDLNDVMKQTNGLLKDIQKSIDLEAMEEMKDNFKAIDEQKNAFNNLFDQYHINEELDEEYNKYEAEIAKEQFQELDKNKIIVEEHQPVSEVNQNNVEQQQSNKNDNVMEEKLAQLE